MDDRLARIRRRFRDFAAAYPAMPLYRTICAAAAEDDDVAGLLLAAQPGQERPVLLLAAVHDLVLRAESPTQRQAGRWFASVVGRDRLPADPEWVDPGPWPEAQALIAAHRADLTGIIASRTMQTNEVNRSTYLLAMLALLGTQSPRGKQAPLGTRSPEPPQIALVEFGASAGLLLTPDHYDVQLTGAAQLNWGDPSSACAPRGEVRAESSYASVARLAAATVPAIVTRVGADLAPIEATDDDRLRWLQACLWPDVPDRVERFAAALAQRRATPSALRPTLVQADLTDAGQVHGVLDRAARAAPEAELVVFTSWTLTYVERAQREVFAATLADFAADTGRTLSWCSAEPADAVPGLPPLAATNTEGTSQLGVRRWRGSIELDPITWGTADPHGRWLQLSQVH